MVDNCPLSHTQLQVIAMQFYVKQENGRYRVASEYEVTTEAAECIYQRDFVRSRKDVLTSPEATRQYLSFRMAMLEHEVFAVLFLDNRHRVIRYEEMFRGTIDGSSVHPREVVKYALRCNAAALIFAHNHPSGIAEPSQADLRITQRLKEALDLIDIRVLDHIIVGGSTQTSLAERGLM